MAKIVKEYKSPQNFFIELRKGLLKQLILELTEMGASTAMNRMNPVHDEVCYLEVCKMADSRRWVDYHIKADNLTAHRRGHSRQV